MPTSVNSIVRLRSGSLSFGGLEPFGDETYVQRKCGLVKYLHRSRTRPSQQFDDKTKKPQIGGSLSIFLPVDFERESKNTGTFYIDTVTIVTVRKWKYVCVIEACFHGCIWCWCIIWIALVKRNEYINSSACTIYGYYLPYSNVGTKTFIMLLEYGLLCA